MMTTTYKISRSLGRALGLLGVAIVSAGFAGCGSSSPQSLAGHKIADRLPALIGPARQYEVTVAGDPFSLARGHVRRILIEGEDVTLSRGLTVDELTIDARNIAVDLASHKLQNIGSVTFEGTIGQAHLDNYIARMKPDIPGLSVDLRWNDLQASVPVSAGSLTTTARLSGRLAPSLGGPNKLDFIADRASVGIVPLPVRIVNLALDRLNPAIDLSGARFPFAISSADVVRGKIVLRGRATISPERMEVANRG